MKLLSIALVTALLGLGAPAFAQTPQISKLKFPGGDSLRFESPGDQLNPAIAEGSNGFLSVWSDERTDPLKSAVANQTTFDIYGVRLDANGAVIGGPIAIATSFGSQSLPKVAWNGQSWLVAWEDQTPTNTFYHTVVRGARVAPDGSLLDTQPFLIADLGQFDNARLNDLTSNGSDWLVVSQSDNGGGVIGFRIATNGVLMNPGGTVLAPDTFFLYFRITLASAGGEYLLAYKAASQFKAQRFSANLAPIGSAFNLPGLSTVGSSGSQYFLAWGSGSGAFLGSRLTTGGVLLDPAGLQLAASGQVVSPGSQRVVWDGLRWWVTWRRTSQGIVAVRVSPSGVILDPTVLEPFPSIAANLRLHDVAPNTGSGGVQFVWEDLRAGGTAPFGVYAAPVSDALVPGAEVALSTASPSQIFPDLAAGNDGYMMAFRSDSAAGSRILIQPLDGFGNPIGTEPIEVVPGPALALGIPDVAWNGSLYLVVWSSNNVILGQRFAPDGSFIDAAPFSIQPGFSADVAAMGDTFLVIASKLMTTPLLTIQPFTVRVDGPTGSILDATPLALGGVWTLNPTVTTFDGRWLATWQNHFSPNDVRAEIVSAFINPDGTTPGSFTVGGVFGIGGSPDVAASASNALFLWRGGTLSNANNDIYGQTMQTDGTLGPIITVSNAAGRQLMPSVVWTGDEFLAAWEDQRNQVAFFDQRTEIYGARFEANGTLLDTAGFPLVAKGIPTTSPELANLQGRTLLATSFFDSGQATGSYRANTVTVGAWKALDGSLPGSTQPILDANGDLAQGSALEFQVSNAPAATFGIHFFGVAQLNQPFLGGTLVPDPIVFVQFSTNAAGVSLKNFTVPNPIPAGTELFVQSWIFDASAPQSFSATGAVRATAP